MAISIGIGSWTDAAYVGVLYPKGLPPADRLKNYADSFHHVEVNSTYYALPQPKAVENWVKQTPDGFTFDIKLHRALSQDPGQISTTDTVKQSTPKGDLVSQTLERFKPLINAGKLGSFLLMLSPFFDPERHDLTELDGILAALRPHSIAVEFRNRAWINAKLREETLAYFRKQRIAWVAVDMPDVRKPGVMPVLDEVTSPDLAYLRLHGRNKKGYLSGKSAAEKHHYLYDEEELEELAARIRKMAKKADMVRVVANNHAEDFAPRTALALKKLLEA